MRGKHWNRREVLAAGIGLVPLAAIGETAGMIGRRIPASESESLPVIGLGTYEVFDVAGSADELAMRREILELRVAAGGSAVDTSPMYNRSETVIGELVDGGVPREPLFLATKVWTDGREAGVEQMRRSAALMRTGVIDLMQVHNLRDTEVHMESIHELTDEGLVRYSGLTHYHAGALPELEVAMRRHKPDFIQINYSLGEREAEDRVLPLAADLGIAVIANRPFQAGVLFGAVRGRDLPAWAGEFADSWGQFFLKFIAGHPAITCVIPATSKPEHMRDNVRAGFGALPDAATRRQMIDFLATL